jgi:preprotein translocase subunit SecF
MTVKFADKPNVEKIRAALNARIQGENTVTEFTSSNAKNQVELGTEMKDEKQLDLNRRTMEEVLANTFGQPGGKLDLNNATQQSLAARLRDPLAAAGVPMNDQQLQAVVKAILEYRDTPPRSGLITDFNQLASVPAVNTGIMNTLKQECYLSPYHILQTQMVGPKVGAELRNKAVYATLYALAGMLVYIAFRFEWIYGLGAVIAVFHDTLITIGLFSIFHEEITMTVIAALLTLVGYSMNDTIVIFDRIRENLKIMRREPLDSLMNKSINQTLSRTIMTSGLTFLTVIALFMFGGPVLHGFSFALVCGIIVGTYSSVFIACPIVLFWHNYADRRRKVAPVMAAPARSETARKSTTRAAK